MSKRQPKISLEWSEQRDPDASCGYNHCFSDTPFGRFLLTWKGWKEYPEYGFDETPWGEVEYHGWDTVADAQLWAEQKLADLCSGLLRGATPPDEAA